MGNKGLRSMNHAARMCPICGEDSQVYNTREAADGTIHRKRRCPSCGARFSTVESFECMVPVKSLSRSRS
ncbi:NrdR family transcriptional regulator [Lawsonibacter sp. JLR.KK007]|uniref:NrdR family transcriptional regulator n=1 Tax=Lawsonibacter sp. JLR.KK007 TaxID=3114293 RepID=UPI002FF3E518